MHSSSQLFHDEVEGELSSCSSMSPDESDEKNQIPQKIPKFSCLLSSSFSLASNPRRCRRCGFVAFSMKAFMCHVRDVHWTDYKCSVCTKQYTNKKAFTFHSCERRRYGAKGIPPTRKSKRMSTKKIVIAAINANKRNMFKRKRKPAIRKRVNCIDCGKWYANRQILRIHQRIHSGEKPFTCTRCKQCFL